MRNRAFVPSPRGEYPTEVFVPSPRGECPTLFLLSLYYESKFKATPNLIILWITFFLKTGARRPVPPAPDARTIQVSSIGEFGEFQEFYSCSNSFRMIQAARRKSASLAGTSSDSKKLSIPSFFHPISHLLI